MIRLNHVSRLYPARAEAPGGMIRALDDFSLHVEPGEWIAVMGPSGSGKSTLVNLIGCLDRPSSGEIWIDSENVAGLGNTELTRVGLKDRAHHLPAQLSGGEQQRACIARALINDPKIILADEPTGNLDAMNEEIVIGLLRELHAQGRTIIMVTHDPVVARLGDRRIELHHGKIAAQEVFAMADEEQFDEVLEELWVLEEHSQAAEIERMDV